MLLYGAIYLAFLPLQRHFVRLLAAAAMGVLHLLNRDPLITGLTPHGNSIFLESHITGTRDVLASWDAGNIHILLVVPLALVLAVPFGTRAARGRLTLMALVAVSIATLAATIVQIRLVAEAYAATELGLTLFPEAEKSLLETCNRILIMLGMILLPVTVFLVSYVSLRATREGRGVVAVRTRSIHPMWPTVMVAIVGLSIWAFLLSVDTAVTGDSIQSRLERLIELSDGSPRAVLGLAVYRFEKGEYDSSGELFDQALAIDPELIEAHLGLGNIEFLKGEYELAAACYQETLNLNPDHPSARYNLGNALYESGHYSSALDAYRSSLELQPNDAATHKNLGVVLLELGEPCKGLRHFERSVELDGRFYRDPVLQAEIARLRPSCPAHGK